MTSQAPGTQRHFANFGGNLQWEGLCFQPQSEAELLELMATHAGMSVRAVGSLHSWSAAPVSNGVVLDVSQLCQLSTFYQDGQMVVRVGAGATLQQALDFLHARTDQTLPTLGAIKRQTISGAVSTATHGSGKPSLSHFVQSLRIAHYDPATGAPVITAYSLGDELRAARCSLGTLGVILSVDFHTVPQYLVEETLREYTDLDSVLAAYAERPLSQFVLAPYRWSYVAFHRHTLDWRPLTLGEKLRGMLTKTANYVGVDCIFHAVLKGALVAGPWAVKAFMRRLPDLMVKEQTHVGRSDRMLTLAHDLFRHEEMEMFLPEAKLGEAVEIIRYAVSVFAAEPDEVSEDTVHTLERMGLLSELHEAKGSYVHHYPIAFRRVPPEDTMIGMSSGSQPYFSCSFFTYRAPAHRDDFYRFCDWLARALYQAVGARLHWGKHFPLAHEEMETVYPELEKFRDLVQAKDPQGVFCTDFTRRVIGL